MQPAGEVDPTPDETIRTEYVPAPAARRRGGSGFALVSAATGLAGIAAYAITWLVPRTVGFAEYTTFAGFWAFVFLVVAMLSGIQQEVTRASHASTAGAARGSGRAVALFTAVVAVGVAAVVLATAPLWAPSAFPGSGAALVVPLAVGLASYVGVAVLSGLLYGASAWRALFAIVTVEGVLRLVLIAGVLAVTTDMTALAWAVALPFPVAAVSVLLGSARLLRGRTRLDVTIPRLAWNVTRTVLAAGSMGLLISGFPLIVQLTSTAEDQTAVGLAVLSSTLVRAPLIVSGMALQSYLIVTFRSRGPSLRFFLLLEGGVVVLGAVLAVLAVLAGPPVFGVLFPGQRTPDGLFIGLLVVSSVLVAALCVSAPAVLARGHHLVYAAGWVAAAAATVLLLLLPGEFETRFLSALLIAPAVGLLVHVVDLIATRTSSPSRPSR